MVLLLIPPWLNLFDTHFSRRSRKWPLPAGSRNAGFYSGGFIQLSPPGKSFQIVLSSMRFFCAASAHPAQRLDRLHSIVNGSVGREVDQDHLKITNEARQQSAIEDTCLTSSQIPIRSGNKS
jgi:hypothetical protein